MICSNSINFDFFKEIYKKNQKNNYSGLNTTKHSEKQQLDSSPPSVHYFSSYISFKGVVHNKLIGYDEEKDVLKKSFIDQITLEKQGYKAAIPRSMLIYGPDGAEKNRFAKELAEQSGCKLVEINPTSESFIDEIQKATLEAKKDYKNNKTRTLIFIKEVEKYLSENKENYQNIGLMKNMLDNCSKKPNASQHNAFATTFLFTASKPLEICDEILLRRGKLNVLVPITPAEGENAKKILKQYVNAFEKVNLSSNTDLLDYETLSGIIKPTIDKGAYSNKRLKYLIKIAYTTYKNETETPFEGHLQDILKKAKCDIKPEALKQYYNDFLELNEN